MQHSFHSYPKFNQTVLWSWLEATVGEQIVFILLLSVTLYLGFIIIIIIIIIMSPILMPLIHNQTCHMPCVQHCCAEPSLCSQLWFKKQYHLPS